MQIGLFASEGHTISPCDVHRSDVSTERTKKRSLREKAGRDLRKAYDKEALEANGGHFSEQKVTAKI
jgi:hypothetical protein